MTDDKVKSQIDGNTSYEKIPTIEGEVFTKGSDDKVKAREWWIAEGYRGNLTGTSYPPRVLNAKSFNGTDLIHVIEMSGYLALQSEIKHERESYNRLHENYCDEVETLTKERDGLRVELKQSKQVNMILRSDYFAVREYWLESDKKKWELKAQLAKYEQESTEEIK